MKTLLVILGYAKANEMMARHWEFYRRSGADIMGVGREDSKCVFPKDGLVWTVNIGKDAYVSGSNLPELHVKAMGAALSLNYTTEHGELREYDLLCMIEPDTLLLKPPPLHRGGLMATYSGGNSPGFLGSAFFHGPWYVDRHTADKFVEFGRAMIERGLIERGFPDRFWGLWRDLYKIKFTPSQTYSRNLIDRPQYIAEAREAIKNGAWAIHGVKTEDQLRAVTEGL